MSDGVAFGHDDQGQPMKAIRMDPDRPLESELEWTEANIAAGLGGQAMQERRRCILDALRKQGGMDEVR